MDKRNLVKTFAVFELLGLVAVYAYYKKIDNDLEYREKLYRKKSRVLEGT